MQRFQNIRRGISKTLLGICCCLLLSAGAKAVVKTSAGTGNWSNPATWSPAGVPAPSDDVVIDSLHTITVDLDQAINRVTVNGGGELRWTAGRRLTLTGNFTVNGTAVMNNGNITLTSPGLVFTLGPRAVFTWEPGTNDAVNATLFIRGTESFSTTSHLIIRKWYSYTVALGSLVTGNFGHLTLNSPGPTPGTIAEWNQNNWFQFRRVTGVLTIDQGWITLDKSGSITSTSIGSIVLTSVNSVFHGHSGTHPSEFTIATNSITNNGGQFFALHNGNGNVTVNVSGNVSNIGNIKIINNSGVAGVSNGNAVFSVAGTFTQNTGDTRIIYNVTTTSSGTYTATFGHLILNNGIFFGQTGCHTGGQTNRLRVTGQFTVNFSLSSSKFRGASLSSIGAVMNNAGFEMTVGGNVTVNGPVNSEFTSSAASGPETIRIGGHYTQVGTTSCYNFGTNAAAHAITLEVAGNLQQSGGFLFFSRNNGTTSVLVSGNLLLTGGQLSLKGGSGEGQMTVRGNYQQSGGFFNLHNNSATATAERCQLTVEGTFSHSGGTFEFENCPTTTGIRHLLQLTGGSVSLSGTGTMTSVNPGTGSEPGLMRYATQGTVSYHRIGNNYTIQQVGQEVAGQCVLEVASGPLVLASHQSNGIDLFRVLTGGTLVMKDEQIRSNKTYAYSFLRVDSAGTLTLTRTAGLYDHGNNGTLDATGNLSFALHPFSVVVYEGSSVQDLTGSEDARSLTEDQYYGILRIQVAPSSSARIKYATLPVRTRLELTSGSLDLNGRELILMNGDGSAVARTEGGVLVESGSSGNRGRFTWKSLTGGLHEFPFFTATREYVPVRFTPLSGTGGSVSIVTQSSDTENQPLPASLSGAIVSVISGAIGNVDPFHMIDRWWQIDAPGFTANIGFGYSGSENTLPVDLRTGYLGVIRWSGINWGLPSGSGMGVTSGSGMVNLSNVSNFGTFTLVANTLTLPVELVDFSARAVGDEVQVNWSTASEINNDYFTLERSTDGENFEPIQQLDGAGNSTELIYYACVDKEPLPGVSYYRLRQTDYDGKYSYSEIKAVNVNGAIGKTGLRIDRAGPNPFEEGFRVFYSIDQAAKVFVRLVDSGGKPVTEEEVDAQPGSNTYEYSGGGLLPRGTYILQLIHQDEISSFKLIRK
jgi:hypothetical protein